LGLSKKSFFVIAGDRRERGNLNNFNEIASPHVRGPLLLLAITSDAVLGLFRHAHPSFFFLPACKFISSENILFFPLQYNAVMIV
jgi:hypothetical protein